MNGWSTDDHEAWSRAIRAPLRLPPNEVFRAYVGGDRVRRFRGHPMRGDDHWPEEWVGSVTTAGNPGPQGETQGLSHVQAEGDRTTLLRDLVAAFPEEMLGGRFVQRFGPTTGVLVKIISLSVPAPLHAHPDRAFAKRHLGSPWGKAEAWVVLEAQGAAGEPAYAGVGAREDVTHGAFRDAIDQHSSERLRAMLHRAPVVPGEAWFLAPGVPHMLGAGVMFIEVQEPSDLAVIPEYWTIGADEAGATRGLGWDVAMGSIDLTPQDRDTVMSQARQPAAVLLARGDDRITGMIGPAGKEFFDVQRLEVGAEVDVDDGRFAVIVAVEGNGWLEGDFERQRLARGDAVVVPAQVRHSIRGGTAPLVAYRCLGPAVR